MQKAFFGVIMNLIADIGNNSAKFFLFQDNRLVLHTRRIEEFHTLIKEWNDAYDIERAIVSSVINLSDEQKIAFNTLTCPVIWFEP